MRAVESAQVNSSSADALNGAAIWCPSGSADACNLIGTREDGFNNMTIYVDESYAYDYLQIGCDANISCIPLNISCDGDAGISAVQMTYDSDGYECSNDTASFCCPYRNCSVFDDPQMGFGATLIDTYSNITELINGTAQNVQSPMECTDSTCAIRCEGLLSCAYAVITTQSLESVIECEGTFSCLGAEVMVDGSLQDHTVKIICLGMCFHFGILQFLFWEITITHFSGSGGCQQMTVNVTNTHSFQLICPTTDSCSDMTVNLRFDDIDADRNNSGVIYCVDQSSCDNLYFRTNSRLSQLFMYRQSDQVIMDNGAGYLSDSENILCITDDWIRFDGFLETEDTIMDSIAEYYPDDDAFPCSDVKVLCGNETISKSCSSIGKLHIQTKHINTYSDKTIIQTNTYRDTMDK